MLRDEVDYAVGLRDRDRRLLKDLVDRMPCYVQMREGWYRPSCVERGKAARNCCDNCRVLTLVKARLRELTA